MARRSCVGVAALAIGLSCASSDPPPLDNPDSDGDGLSDRDEMSLYGTSPLQADTDGDGFSDSVEILGHSFDPLNDPLKFNPRIADVPRLGIELTSAPSIRVHTTEANGENQTFTTAEADTVSDTVTNGSSWQDRRSDTLSTPQTVTDSISVTDPVPPDRGDASDEGGGGGNGGGGSVSRDTSISSTVDPSTTVESVYTFSTEEAFQNQQTLINTQAYEQSHEVTAQSGSVRLTASLVNFGNIGYRVGNILLTAFTEDESGAAYPLGNLAVDSPYSTVAPFALAAGQRTAPLNFVVNGLSIDATFALLGRGREIVVRLGVTELDDVDGKPFEARAADIASKTVTVLIDGGLRRPIGLYNVATNLDPAHPGVTVGRLFEEILRLPFEADPDVGLTILAGMGTNTSGAGRWTVERKHGTGIGAVTTPFDAVFAPYDFRAIELHAGDVLHIAYVDA